MGRSVHQPFFLRISILILTDDQVGYLSDHITHESLSEHAFSRSSIIHDSCCTDTVDAWAPYIRLLFTFEERSMG